VISTHEGLVLYIATLSETISDFEVALTTMEEMDIYSLVMTSGN